MNNISSDSWRWRIIYYLTVSETRSLEVLWSAVPFLKSYFSLLYLAFQESTFTSLPMTLLIISLHISCKIQHFIVVPCQSGAIFNTVLSLSPLGQAPCDCEKNWNRRYSFTLVLLLLWNTWFFLRNLNVKSHTNVLKMCKCSEKFYSDLSWSIK